MQKKSELLYPMLWCTDMYTLPSSSVLFTYSKRDAIDQISRLSLNASSLYSPCKINCKLFGLVFSLACDTFCICSTVSSSIIALNLDFDVGTIIPFAEP